MVRRHPQNSLQEQLAFGHEVTIRPEASLITGKKPYVVRLSDPARSAVLDFASMAMYFKQMIIAQDKYFEDGTITQEPEAPLDFQELFLEALNMGLSYSIVGGKIIYLDPDSEGNYPDLPEPPIENLTIEQAIAAGFTVPENYNERKEILPATEPKTYEDNIRPVDGLDRFLVVYAKTIAGPAGTDGTNGTNGTDGTNGTNGADGDCSDCVPPDGGGGGPPGGDGGGSGGPGTGGTGPDGSGGPNPDNEDKIVFIPGCADPIINFPFCSDAFSFSNADLRGAIEAAVTATGEFDSSSEELISVTLEWNGAAYGGIATVQVPTSTDYLPPQSNTAKFLRVEDAANNKMVVPHTIESFGIDPVLVVQGYHYSGTTGLRMIPEENPIILNGQMSNYPLIGGANCHSPADESDPAWLKVCLRQFVKHTIPMADIPCPSPTSDNVYSLDFHPNNTPMPGFNYDGNYVDQEAGTSVFWRLFKCFTVPAAGASGIHFAFKGLQYAGNDVWWKVAVWHRDPNNSPYFLGVTMHDHANNAVANGTFDNTLYSYDLPFDLSSAVGGEEIIVGVISASINQQLVPKGVYYVEAWFI